MTWKSKQILAVVPARGGSKGIPKKNLAVIDGSSLIRHVGKTVSSLPWLDAAILSTDDLEIAEEGRRSGIEVPFMRPDYLASDEASSIDMWRHAWLECEKIHQKRYDISILLEPTSPLRTPQDIERTITTLIETGRDAAATVSRTPAHFTPQKCLTVNAENILHFYLPDGAQHSRRQTIPPYYYRNGVCYAVTRESLVDKGNIIQDDCVAVIIGHTVVNIDDPLDLEWAEFLLKKKVPAK